MIVATSASKMSATALSMMRSSGGRRWVEFVFGGAIAVELQFLGSSGR